MEQKNRQPKWDILEAAILLDGYLFTMQKKEPKSYTIKRISNNLRALAVNRGISIDSVYRNENGISYQLQSMESAYLGRKVYVPATRLFLEIVHLYREDNEKYIQILEEAKEMIDAKFNNKDAFLAWSASIVSPKKIKTLDFNISRVEQFGIKANLISGSIYDISEIEILEDLLDGLKKSKLFQINNRKIYKHILDSFLLYMRFCLQLNKNLSSNTKNEFEQRTNNPAYYDNTLVTHGTDGIMLVDYHSINSMVYTQPVSLDYKGIHSVSHKWGHLYVELLSQLQVEYPEVFIESADKEVFHSNGLMIASESNKKQLRMPRAIGNGFYIEGNCSATRIVKNIRSFLDLCKVDYNQVIIKYRETSNKQQQKSDSAAKPEIVNPNSGIVKVLKQYYQYGFKYESIRELMRFRQFAEEMNVIIPEDDEVLKIDIISSGILIDDKIFCKNDNMVDELCELVDSIFANGTDVIYYECLLNREADWMASHVITSEKMLKEYLMKHISGCSFSKKFFVNGKKLTEKEAVTSEIIRVWSNRQTESVEELSNRLPYIPLDNLWRVISGNDLFVLSSEGVYLLLDRFHINDNEKERILDFVKITCEKNGYASLSDVPLGDIEEENYELSLLAIHNAIYKKVLSEKYYLNGKILTMDKPELDAVTLLKHYISGRTTCSFDEVADKVIELTGRNNRQYAFQALYDEMVRTDINQFVSNDNVCFNVNDIDNILSDFITDHFLAIRDITTFAMFPVSGQSWNYYLLESYCYKFSRKFSLHVLNFNDKNAGIIAEKEYNMQYVEMLAIALARDNVELTTDVAGSYLFNCGYMAKSKYARLDEIVQRAKEIRKGS